jgi:hypothetical protein
MSDIKDFPHKLNEFITEEVEIPATLPVYDDKTKKVSFQEVTQKAVQKTFYAHSVPRQAICTDHVFDCLDKGRYLFRCQKCTWTQIAPPRSFRFDPQTGKLTRRLK